MTRFAAVAMMAVAFVGCGGDSGDQSRDAPAEAEAAPEPGTVTIVQPADGAELEVGPVLFVLETSGVEIVAAGNMDPGTGHHHLIVDGEVDWELPIPNDVGVHYHMGQAETELTLTDLTPGEHRIIAVVADGVHIPLDPPVSDTITVVVR